ncbi:hypothetical protein D5S18_28060 [Nocardia panacis]|uniref:RiboL-PSP-HEPN domain-containing protein n=1 Tax=Nocardia panacis TaxID=2340916 RepID=A0A3A4K5N3_9NOCA|nr:hypothetical protein D5S18_28060 [Nocardia panacis]
MLANRGTFGGSMTWRMSIRVRFDRTMAKSALESDAKALLNSLVYELDVRNDLKLRLVAWPIEQTKKFPVRRHRNREVRFPEIEVDPQVAALFSFAGTAAENPPLAFLSYYQVLETYFPTAIKRSALRELELALADPRFDRKNKKSLGRILSIGEGVAGASENSALRELIEHNVRDEELRDFFVRHDWGKQFTKQGPIIGIEDNINVDNKQVPLAYQVADRVYRIRNRIVHTKGDFKYKTVPPLLPQSVEAEQLYPDIELLRLLAYEVILCI